MKSAPNNSYAVILGASSGFGKAVALSLAKAGYHIIGVHLDRASTIKTVDEITAEINNLGVRALFYNVNAADSQKRREVIEAISQEFSTQDSPAVRVLMHSLAFGTLKKFISSNPVEAIKQRQIEMTMDVMANSLLYWAQDLIHGGYFGDNGRIFALTSAGSTRVLPMYGAVSAAKAALEAYIRQLALELAPMGITANAIRAGVTETPALRKIPGNDVIIESAVRRNPHHRLTTPEDVANAVSLLVREESNWINGSVIGVDGGEDAVDLTWWKN